MMENRHQSPGRFGGTIGSALRSNTNWYIVPSPDTGGTVPQSASVSPAAGVTFHDLVVELVAALDGGRGVGVLDDDRRHDGRHPLAISINASDAN